MHETTKRDTASTAAQLSATQLVERLSHPNGWWRDLAQRQLVERNERSVIGALTQLARTAKDWKTRQHALWTLDGLDGIEPATVVAALDDPSREVRVSAIRIAERWLGEPNNPVQAAVLKRLDDPEWPVRHQLAATLGVMPAGVREQAAVRLLDRSGDDPVTLDATLSGLRGSEVAVLEQLLKDPASTPQREAAATMIAATIARGAQDSPSQKLLGAIGDDSRPEWQRAALIRGAEVVLLGAAMPGTGGRRAGGPAAAPDAPCPTCPGGRAGPGGSYAFPQAARPPATRQPPLRLNAEPVSFEALAAKGGDLGGRAEKLLARVEWPGENLAPLLPSSHDARTAAAVHGRSGGVSQRLSGLPSAGRARGWTRSHRRWSGRRSRWGRLISVRILLHGKEGSVGLMPPVGQIFTDEQIAAALMYVRREWGPDWRSGRSGGRQCGSGGDERTKPPLDRCGALRVAAQRGGTSVI